MATDEELSIRHQAAVMARNTRSRASIAHRYAARCHEAGLTAKGYYYQEAAEALDTAALKLQCAAE